jgi:competence protein ComEC
VLNLFFIPLVSFVIYPLSLISFICPFVSNILSLMVYILEEASLFFSKIDFLNITLARLNIVFYVLYYCLITLSLIKNKYLLILCSALIIHNNILFFNQNPFLVMLDVGQGDSFLIVLEHNKGSILIDTGGNQNYDLTQNTLIPYFKAIGLKKISYLILSHGDKDHMGESSNLVNNFQVDNIILNSGHDNDDELNLIKLAKSKNINTYHFSQNKLLIDDYSFTFLNEVNTKDENKDSLIIRAKIKKYHILFMGDAGITEEKILAKKNIRADILKVGHHGSKYSTADILLDVVKPEIALISVGKNNFYGHPSKEVMDKLDNIKTYLTSENGSVKISFKEKLVVTYAHAT